MLEAMKSLRLIYELFCSVSEPVSFDFQSLTSFLDGLLNGSTDAHNFTYGPDLQTQPTSCPLNLLTIPSGDFYDNVIQCRLKKGRSGFGDLVFKFIEVITNGELCSNFSNGITGCL